MLIRGCFLILVVAAICTGCSGNGVTVIAPAADSVSNENGIGSATIAGVSIRVLGLNQNGAGVTHSVKTDQAPAGTTHWDRWDVSFGEVKLILERDNDQTILLNVDGANYGTVVKGDDLRIDADRNVTVNGQEREKQATQGNEAGS